MEFRTFFPQDLSGTYQPGATATVRIAGTSTLATIYDENDVEIANPATADPSGRVAFAAADGFYDITFAATGPLAASRVLENVQFYDSGQFLQEVEDIKRQAEDAASAAAGEAAAAVEVTLSDFVLQAEGARDSAQGHAGIAAAEAANALSAVSYQDLTAIAETISKTAVDVLVYDTSLDSDGGAWRKRTQNTSWYNETLNTATRGATRELPSAGFAIAESSSLTAYDGTDPNTPMWKVWDFTGLTITSVAYYNGAFVVGTSTGVVVLDLIADDIDVALKYSTATSPAIVSSSVNDVAMTVLPDAPVDPATGLPVPTIAVATDVGVSVIKDDGTVWSPFGVGYAESELSIQPTGVSNEFYGVASRAADPRKSAANNDTFYLGTKTSGNGNTEFFKFNVASETWTAIERDWDSASGVSTPSYQPNGVAGLVSLVPFPVFNESMVAYTTPTYNTGWMPGDIKGAFLSDTDDTDLSFAELVTNGDFSTNSDWTLDAATTISGGVLSTTKSGSGEIASQSIPITSGKLYRIKYTVVSTNGELIVPRLSGASESSAPGTNTTGIFEAFVRAVSDVDNFAFNVAGSGVTAEIDDVSVVEVDEDRSINANGLVVNGTITRAPVATGADLVAYSGFSASNYLEQPYNSDLDFGTGDFCVMGWFNQTTSTSTQYMLTRTDGTTAIINVGMTSVNDLLFALNSSIYARTSSGVYSDNVWNHVAFVRIGGVSTNIYLNGVLSDTGGGGSVDVTNTNASLYIGDSPITSPFEGSLALWRISATAPSPEQIKKIYEDERVLFQENAQATLYGTSDAVTALASDPVTDLLHAGTSDGRSVFQGLRRVSNTTDAVGTVISAVNDLVVED